MFYDVLPSPSNLLKWGLLETPNCQPCGTWHTMTHIMSCCKLALIRCSVPSPTHQRKKFYKNQSQPQETDLHESGLSEQAKQPARPLRDSSILKGSARQMKLEHMRILIFPNVIQTTLRPDIILWSAENKSIVIELWVSWEEGGDDAQERWNSKYRKLKEEC